MVADLDSPQAVYLAACATHRVRVNTGVLDALGNDSFESIVRLDFSRNCLGQKGLNPLIPVVERCVALRELAVADNYLSNESVVSLCDALEKLPKLEVLKLSRNPISYPSGKRIESLVAQSATLATVDITSTLMNPALASRVMATAASKARPAELNVSDLVCVPSDSGVAASSRSAAPALTDGVSPRPLGDFDDDAATTSNSMSMQSASMRDHPTKGATPPQAQQQLLLSASTTPGSVKSAPAESASQLYGKMPATRAVRPDDPWYAMETVWSVAADAEHQADGGRAFHGLLCIMTQMRRGEDAAVAAAAAPVPTQH